MVANGRVLMDWVSARVEALAPRPMQCYRCLEIDHTRNALPRSTGAIDAIGVAKRGTRPAGARRSLSAPCAGIWGVRRDTVWEAMPAPHEDPGPRSSDYSCSGTDNNIGGDTG